MEAICWKAKANKRRTKRLATSSQVATLKREIEAKLASRIPAALSPQARQIPRLLATGVTAIDTLLGGGLPLGGISEFTGLASSGRTSLAFSLLAQTSPDSACAWIDADDSVDPRSAAAAGVCLSNLLWVRLPGATELIPRQLPSSAISSVDNCTMAGQLCGSLHPRTETKGMDHALEQMFAQKQEARLEKREGTPGFPNRGLNLTFVSEEQIRYEQLHARRPDASDPIRQSDQRAAAEARLRAQAFAMPRSTIRKEQEKPWSRLDKVIRATDQLLQSGGFRVVVLDLASTPQDQVVRIPAATWFRFRRAAQGSDAILLLLTQVACARSSALCVLDCASESANSGGGLLNGLSRSVEVARQRIADPYAKKAPGRVAAWEATSAWMRAAGR